MARLDGDEGAAASSRDLAMRDQFTFDNGATVRAPVVIGADGIRSSIAATSRSVSGWSRKATSAMSSTSVPPLP